MNYLDKLKALEAAAAPGPWKWGYGNEGRHQETDITNSNDYSVIERDSGIYPPDLETGDLIITLRNIARELIGVVEASAKVMTCTNHDWTGPHKELDEALMALEGKVEEV